MNRPTLPAPVNGDFDIEIPDGTEVRELPEGEAVVSLITDFGVLDTSPAPLEPHRPVVTMAEQRRIALSAHPEARLSPEARRDLVRQINEVKTDSLGLWG